MKRFADIVLSSLALVLASPLLLIVAVAIRFASPGPALFRQQRIGLGGRPFMVVKFRTMHESRSHKIQSYTTIANDPRVFLLGQLLRRTKVDELPQLINVLLGQMSLVGPRPTVSEDHDRMTPAQQHRVAVRPGITGLAQVRGGAMISWPRRVEFDLQYISQQSLWLDFKILVETIRLLASGRADQMPSNHDEWAEAA